LNGEDASGRVSGLSEILTGMIRAAVAGVTAGRPVLGLVAPPVRVRVEPAGADTVVWIDTTSDGIGVGRLLGRCLRRNVEDELAALLDHDLPIDSAALLLPRDLSDAQMDLLAGIRSLVRHAVLTRDADRFVAEVLRSDRRTKARELLALLQGRTATTARRRRVHAQLRRLRVPRPAEVEDLLAVRIDDPVIAALAGRRYDEVLSNWPAPVDIAVEAPAAPQRTEKVVAVPELGNPAEEVTRRGLLDQVGRRLADKRAAARVALIGGGGMGKSALAVRICRHVERDYQVVGWLSATDSASWRSSVALLAERLGLAGTKPDDFWRALGDHTPALIVVDDAPEPGAFTSSLPWTAGLHLLVTSQSIRWRAEAHVIELKALDEHDGVEFLLARTGAEDEELAAAVTRRLGGFPLALEQAAAAVVDGLSMRGWLDRYGREAATGVAALHQAWSVRIETLRANHPDALMLLRILACAGPAPVPGELLATLGADFDEPAVAVCADTGRRDTAVAELRTQALIRTGADVETLVVHPLLAEVVRADPEFDAAGVALLVGAVAGHLVEVSDVNEPERWSRTAALLNSAVAACRLVFEAVEQDPRRFAQDVVLGLANHALWLSAAYLHERGAARAAYRIYLLGLAMHGDPTAAAIVRNWLVEVIDAFDDLDAADLVPAEQLGHVPAGEPRMSAARWINEAASLLMDVNVAVAEAYARRALAILPRRVAAAARAEPIPWPDTIRIEILDNLGFILMLRGDYHAAVTAFDRAIRHLLTFPGADAETKYAELLSDRALALLDSGLPEKGRRQFTTASAAAQVNAQGPEVPFNIDNNLAKTEHLLWRLRPAHQKLRAGLDWLLDRNPPQSSTVMIQQCNLGLVAYDLGATDEGLALVRGSWQTLADRLGPEDREVIIRRLALAQLQLARGDRAAANEAVLIDLRLSGAVSADASPWSALRRLQSAWLGGVAALPPETALGLASELARAFGPRSSYAAVAGDFLAAWALADPSALDQTDVEYAARAVRTHALAAGTEHPLTLLAAARLALLRWDATGGRRPLRSGVGRRLLHALDSLTGPGVAGFAKDLSGHGQPPVDMSRPGWEADRILHLYADGVVDLDAGEQLCWRANAGRLAALARLPNAEVVLSEAADGSAALYGPLHPWTLLRAAAAAVAAGDPASLRITATAPMWI
jgi:tetratricopeptide (TPR) repeat protein